jgi:hypothetical protein
VILDDRKPYPDNFDIAAFVRGRRVKIAHGPRQPYSAPSWDRVISWIWMTV